MSEPPPPSSSWQGLPQALRAALGACWAALDAEPWELPDEALRNATLDALGPALRVLRGEALAQARRSRPDLDAMLERDGGALALPGRVPVDDAARQQLWTALEGARGETPWERAVHVPPESPLATGLRRHGVLAWRSAQSVVPMWMHAHPEDERALALLNAIERAIEQDAWQAPAMTHALRDALERDTPVADPALTALRALVLAHDLVTQSEARVERVGLPELCAYAWLDAPAELVPAARSGEPMARAEAWFRWWLAEAVPGAWRAGA